MKVKLTNAWMEQLEKIKRKGFIINSDFIHIHEGTTYSCNQGEELTIDNAHYAASNDLQLMVTKGWLEIV